MTRLCSLHKNRSLAVLCLMLLSVLIGAGIVLAQAPARPAHTPPPAPLGAGFTYQGELRKSGFAVSDNTCAMTFSLWTAARSSSPVVSPTGAMATWCRTAPMFPRRAAEWHASI